MTRTERENLIERYLHGDMSLAEEENFFIEVAANRELRYELKAYQVVERAIAADRTSTSRNYTALRGRMQQQLAASQSTTTVAGVATRRFGKATAWIGGAAMMIALGVAGGMQWLDIAPSAADPVASPGTVRQQQVQKELEEPETFIRREMKWSREHSPGFTSPAPADEREPVLEAREKSETAAEAIAPAQAPRGRRANERKPAPVDRQMPARPLPAIGHGSRADAAATVVTHPSEKVDDSISIRFNVMAPRAEQP